ncbi:RHS repeat-associated core domain-containing protein [Pseudomonas sp. NPDC089395]|uniref:RHS repeat-associated core domain-containing protein n=1 Tax=Pseudomonas sp. NPDC089395 TaxID=3364460 RepID=UPI003815DAF2
MSTLQRQAEAGAKPNALYFYQGDALVVEVSGQHRRQILWGQEQALAQIESIQPPKMLQVDRNNSVLSVASVPMVYSPYGHLDPEQTTALLAFNGQRRDAAAQGYHLGNGHRLLSSSRCRFGSPDVLSPFGVGGINAYAYCLGDPVNNIDPSGHFSIRAWLRTSKVAVNYRLWKAERMSDRAFNMTEKLYGLERGIEATTAHLNKYIKTGGAEYKAGYKRNIQLEFSQIRYAGKTRVHFEKYQRKIVELEAMVLEGSGAAIEKTPLKEMSKSAFSGFIYAEQFRTSDFWLTTRLINVRSGLEQMGDVFRSHQLLTKGKGMRYLLPKMPD